MKAFSFRIIFTTLFSLLFLGCTKDGEVGPQGPEGAQGPQGNANVKTLTFTNQAFTLNPLAGVYQVIVDVTEINAEIVKNGYVAAFVSKANNNGSDWTALPGNFTPDFLNMSLQRFYNFNYSSGQATIYTSSNPGYNVDLKIAIVAGP